MALQSSTTHPEPPRERDRRPRRPDPARVRHLVVRPLPRGAAADRQRLRRPSGGAPHPHRGRQRPAARALVRRQALADAGLPARRPGAGARGPAAQRRRDRSRLRGNRSGPFMKIATFNVNGITSRLPRVLEWLAEAQPDIACLQELKTSDETFPAPGDRGRGLQRGLARAEGLQRRRRPGRGGGEPGRAPARPAGRPRRHAQPLPRGLGARRGRRLDLPAQRQSAAGAEVRLQARLVRAPDRACREPDRPAPSRCSWSATTTSSPPTARATSTTPPRGARTRCCSRRAATPTGACSRRAGPTRSTRCTKASRSTPSGTTSATASRATPACASITCCSTRRRAQRLSQAGVDRAVRGREKPSDHAPAWVVLD